MGYYYKFYNAEDNCKLISEGKFVGMPFYWDEDVMPVKIPMVFGSDYLSSVYNCTGLLDRATAVKVQKYMKENNTLFTDLMDEYHTDTLVFRIV